MKANTFAPEFVEYIPGELDDGVLYVSIPYCTAVHRCACGCGNKVVTPISPAEWQILFDGEAVSLFPSVGNWGFPCQAHYWIRSNRVVWAKAWTATQIDNGRAREDRARAEYFARRSDHKTSAERPRSTITNQRVRVTLISRIAKPRWWRFGRRRRTAATGNDQ